MRLSGYAGIGFAFAAPSDPSLFPLRKEIFPVFISSSLSIITGAPRSDKKQRMEKKLFSESTPNAKPVICIATVSPVGSQKQPGGCAFEKAAQQTLLIIYDT